MPSKKQDLFDSQSSKESSITDQSQLKFYTAKNLETGLSQGIKNIVKLQTSLALSRQAKDQVWNNYFKQISKIGDKLLEAVIKRNKFELTRLLNQYPIDVSDFLYMDGWSLLHFGVIANDVEIISILLKHGIDIDIQSKEMRRTALHEAVLINRIEIVRLLIDSGANPNLADADRNTAIHFSIDYGYFQIIKIILNSKIPVQLSLTNCNNMTPFNSCRTASVLQLLLSYHSSNYGVIQIMNENEDVYDYQSRLRIYQKEVIPNISRIDQVQKFLSFQQNSHKLKNTLHDSYQSSILSELSMDSNNEEKCQQKKRKTKKGVGFHLKNQSILKSCKKAQQNIGLRRETIFQSYIKDEQKIENYEIIKKIGAGAFAEVFSVRKKRSSNMFALKKIDKKLVIDKQLYNYVNAEKFVLTEINHPFILKAFACLQDFTHLFLVVQLCEGGDMEKYIRKSTLSQAVVKTYACEAALALDELHKHNILYRDLKVSNVMLDRRGHLKLADFGLAKQAQFTDSFVGSISYLPPELLVEGIKKPHNKSVDWYLLGVFIYQLLQGEPVFYNEDRAVMQDKILNEQLTFSKPISPQCQEVMTRLLDKNPQNRLNSLDDLKALKWFDGVNWQKILNKQGQVMSLDIDCRQLKQKDYFPVQFQQKQINANIQWFHDWNYSIKL